MSALLGRIPSAVGYQPTLATDMGLLQVRPAPAPTTTALTIPHAPTLLVYQTHHLHAISTSSIVPSQPLFFRPLPALP